MSTWEQDAGRIETRHASSRGDGEETRRYESRRDKRAEGHHYYPEDGGELRALLGPVWNREVEDSGRVRPDDHYNDRRVVPGFFVYECHVRYPKAIAGCSIVIYVYTPRDRIRSFYCRRRW